MILPALALLLSSQEPPAPEGPSWAFSAAAYAYIVPDGRDYVQPTVTADYGALHLEGRYNYETLDTGSAWVGVNFTGGSDVTWDLTPMLGGVFGATYGIAPGYKGSVNWWKLSLYSEGEYVHDVDNNSDSFFYTWTELTISPLEWLRVGFVTQRTLGLRDRPAASARPARGRDLRPILPDRHRL